MHDEGEDPAGRDRQEDDRGEHDREARRLLRERL
jgi:hypothetical protein